MRVPQSPTLPPGEGGFTMWAVEQLRRLFAAVWQAQEQSLCIACSDESTALTAGTAKVTFRFPWACRLTKVRVTLSTAQATGSIFTADINFSAATVLATKLTIDNTEKTSRTAATPFAFTSTDTLVDDDEECTIDIDQVGDGTAKGLKVWFFGVRP